MNMHATLLPTADAVIAQLEQGNHQLLSTTLVVDLETPVSAMLKLMEENSPAFLLESVEGGEVRGRYSIIGIAPDLVWRSRGAQAEISMSGRVEDSAFTPLDTPALPALKELIRQHRMEIPAHLPPMSAGLIGYVGYNMVSQMEAIPDTKPDPIGIPDACLMRPTLMAIFDSVAGVVYLVAPIWARAGLDAAKAYQSARARIMRAMEKLAMPLDPEKRYQERKKTLDEPVSNCDFDTYATMVERAKEYIAAGDIFQVVPSRRFAVPFDLPPFALYRAVRHINPSPFLFYLNFGSFALVGASPEILVRLRENTVTIRPIAGTRRRGTTPAEDAAQEKDLLTDPKEIAEHLMLLDLGRNDVGRVSKTGTVRVTEKMVVERYSHVMHIVSNVQGELRDELDAVDALVAGFPAGTVSGAPKIRAMEIIDELEPERRSFYGGCVGYFSAGGSMDTCITLRTGLVKDGMLYVQSGGGVVADSTARGEFDETTGKARAMLRAAEEAVKFI